MTGFLFDELSDLKKNIMREIKEKYPEDTKKFIKSEAQKARNLARKIGKKRVGTSKGLKKNWSAEKSYHRRWKSGKPYKYSEGDICCRVYNSAPHGHLIELGHANIPRGTKRATTVKGRQEQKASQKASGYTLGKLVVAETEVEFLSDFLTDAEKFMYEHFTGAINGK